ncbi:MAG TPA: trypsin-like peptidase domain-containing protein, partial [Iamia sp.]|nr:trypsin-like peptidase domain-containing protein [Iamia sp.]
PGAGAPPVGSPDPTWAAPLPPAGPGWGRPDPGAPPAGPPPAAPGSGPSPSRGRRPKMAGLALVVALLLGAAAGAGFAAGESLADDDTPAAATTTEPAASTGTVQGVDATTEPVAAVAEALSPAVVQLETQTGLGSGFVYDADEGLIMTAAHVVEGADAVTVRLADGRAVDGTVVGSDAGSDIAVVRVEADGLTAAVLATGDPEVGQLAVAIGSPFGLDQTVTSGVVSAVGRSVQTPGGAVPMIQTDAPINPGNSGGALADRTGRVIGVNDSIASESGGNVGVGFAVPIETAKAVADRLVQGLPITNGYLGVSAADASGQQSGAQVVQVESGSPGDEAGIEAGDVVTSLDGDAIASSADLVAAVRSREPGTEVIVGLDRQGDEVEVTLTLGEAPTN